MQNTRLCRRSAQCLGVAEASWIMLINVWSGIKATGKYHDENWQKDNCSKLAHAKLTEVVHQCINHVSRTFSADARSLKLFLHRVQVDSSFPSNLFQLSPLPHSTAGGSPSSHPFPTSSIQPEYDHARSLAAPPSLHSLRISRNMRHILHAQPV